MAVLATHPATPPARSDLRTYVADLSTFLRDAAACEAEDDGWDETDDGDEDEEEDERREASADVEEDEEEEAEAGATEKGDAEPAITVDEKGLTEGDDVAKEDETGEVMEERRLPSQ